MGKYEVNHRYQSYRDGAQYGPYEPGTVIDLDDVDAEWVNRDSPGALSPVGLEPALIPAPQLSEVDEDTADPGEEDSPESDEDTERAAPPARNRQHKGGRNRSAG